MELVRTTLRTSGQAAVRVISTVLAMSGFRLGRLNTTLIAGGAASLVVARLVMLRDDPALTVAYFGASVAFYYAGNAIVLGSSLARAWIQRVGEERAWRDYQTLLALMFMNQGFGLGAMGSLSRYTLALPANAAVVAGLALAAVGLVIKVWSTMVLGLDLYYYRDLFVGRSVSTFVARGPYRFLANPMYGIGQLHAYGYAIANRSLAGLLAAAACNVLIYLFYFAVERPFIARVYLAAPQSPEAELPASVPRGTAS